VYKDNNRALGGLREVVTGVLQISTEHQDVFKGCALGKFTKASFPSSDTRSTGILDLVHTNVYGPMTRKSLSGCEYYLTFIDDYSRKTWIYFLKAKSGIFKWFQEFRALVENQYGKRIKVLWCALGKFTKASFPSSDTRSAGILDLVHTNVCGPMTRKSLSGCEYYLTFIDDYSRKTWIYFLKAKSGVFKWFQEFRALVENQSGKRIKVLWSDNGGEYSSRQFIDFCAQHGIRRQMTVPYNPQQNGVSERKNRAITSATRSMLHD
jgi:hypothetical protein